MNKNKRKILKTGLLISLLPMLSSCNTEKKITDTSKYKKVSLKMVTSFPKNLPGADLPAQKLANKIYQLSDGLIAIKHYAAGELVPAFEVFDAVSSGTAECGISAPYYWASKNKSMSFFLHYTRGYDSVREVYVVRICRWTEVVGQSLF